MKKRNTIRIKYENIFGAICIFSFVLYLVSVMWLKSINIELQNSIVRTNNEITVIKSEVDSLTMNIKNLTDYNRVLDSIDATNMTNRNSTVITIGD